MDGNVACMGEKIKEKKSREMRLLVGPMSKWQNNIKIDFARLGYE
jgi:hypothetical protein